MRRLGVPLLFFAAAVAVAGCGSSSKSKAHAPQPTTRTPSTAAASTQTAPTTTSPSALQAEANSAAAGDIPDNQVFIRYRNAAGRYSMKYPEGWAQQGSGANATFRDKNNIVRVVVTSGARPSAGSVRREVAGLHGAHLQSGPQGMTIGGLPAFKVVYTTQSAPNAVTGKRVTLGVDRYYLWKGGKVAIVDLGSPIAPVKVDNVDAYRLIIQSFRWR